MNEVEMVTVGQDAVLRQVLSAAAAVFDRPVGESEDFFDLGGDSVTAVEFVVVLERRLGAAVDPATLFATASFGRLAEAIYRQTVDGGEVGRS